MTDSVTETARLATLAGYRLLDTPAEPQFDAIVRAAAHGLDAPMAAITLIDGRRYWFKARLGFDTVQGPLASSLCTHAIRSDELLVVPDAALDLRFAAMECVTGPRHVRFYAGAPLVAPDGARLGALCIVDTVPRDGLDEADRAYLTLLARRTVAAFDLRREMLNRTSGARGSANPGVPKEVWLEQAATLLTRASATLEQVGATQPLAELEHVIALVDRMRHPAVA